MCSLLRGARAGCRAPQAGIPQIYLGSAQLHAMGELHLTIGRMRVEHLVRPGHTARLAFAFAGDETLRPLGDYWLTGLRAAAVGLPEIVTATVAAGLGPMPPTVVQNWIDADGVTAVCAQSDETALVVLHGIREAGLRCPQDLAVMGVDAIPLGRGERSAADLGGSGCQDHRRGVGGGHDDRARVTRRGGSPAARTSRT